MPRRTKIIIAAIILVLLLLLLLFLGRHTTSTPATNQAVNATSGTPNTFLLNTGTTTSVNTAPAPVTHPVTTQAPKPAAEANLGRLAAAFAERYGSYSNLDNDFANLVALKVFMSSGMIGRTDAYIAKEQGKPPAKEHYGITTRAINTTTTAFADADGRAEISVKTQRQEFVGNTPNGTVKYQDVDIAFVKEDGVWKVNSATWK